MEAISQLIDRAEAAYTAGLNDYQSGDFSKSKQEFDQSLSILLSSPYDIRNNNRLNEEFDLLADHINDAELSAIQHGNSLSAHQYVPTPIESFSGLTFPVDPNVAKQVQQEIRTVHLDIPLVSSNDTVSGIIAYLQKHARGYIERVLQGAQEYGPMISAALQKEGLPHDLLYLPGPESAYDPHATSVKGAKGLWQLMSETAPSLKQNRWIDEREDPYLSTLAAAADLKELYKTFGDWYLALAAYDTGPLNIQRAIERTGYADYWKLREMHVMVPETQNYVPVFLATALIAKDPQAYGFTPPSTAPIEFDRVPVTEPTDLRLVAGIVGRPVEELIRLNPALKGYETPADDPHYMLNLPSGTKDIFEKEIALVPLAGRLWWRATRVIDGQTVNSIANQYHVTSVAIVQANQLAPDDPLAPDAPVLIPLARPRMVEEAGVRWVRRPYYYRVRPGDNIDLIADHFDVSPYQIRRWNHLRSSRLARGRRLLVYRLVQEKVVTHHRYSPSRKRYASR
ncbi:MAG TPA: transglycosylase SLT domain-containing protein [Terriglobia bacterium]|nr:transglycosylase SLT domain-containing protein [Terriglobia bacterium]